MRVTIPVAFALLVGASPVAAVEGIVRYAGDTLTVRLTEVPLAEVLEEIGRQTQATIRGAVRQERVSASFDRVPLDDALARLLGDHNFTLRYGRTGQLREVDLLSASPGLLGTALILKQAVAGHSPVPVSGRAAEALGATRAPMTEVMRAALHDRDPRVRAEALQAGLSAMDKDPAIRSAVLLALGTVGDRNLATMLRRAPDGYGEQLLDYVLTEMHDGEIRAKASALLTELRRQVAAGRR